MIGAVSNTSQPTRRRTPVWVLAAALAVAPLGWLVALVADYGLASHACFPGDTARLSVLAGWGWLWPAMLAIFIAGLVAAAAGVAVSVRNWRRSRLQTGPGRDLTGGAENGARFLAAWGMIAGGGFIVAGGFNLVALFGMPLCGFH